MKYIHAGTCSAAKGSGSCYCRRNRGYMVQRELKAGDLVTIFDDFTVSHYEHGKHTGLIMRGGDVAKLEGFSNAGFNGILASLTFEGKRLHNVDAGMLVKADNGASYHAAVMEEYDRRIAAAHAAVRHAQKWADEYGLPLDAIGERARV